MKAKTRFAILSVGVLAGAPFSATATVAVVSNLQEAGQAPSILRDSSGIPLPFGTGVRLVTFPGKSAAEISVLAGGGSSGLLAAAVPFAGSSAIGAGGNGAGWFEFQTGAPLSAPLGNPHVLVTKGTAELLLLRLPLAIPADELAGPEGHIAVHLDDAEVVFGSRDSSGFATAVSPGVVEPTPFETWIAGELGEETHAADLLPEADADRDGVVNLMEYAAGSDPGDGGSRAQVRLRRSAGGTYFFQYLRRTGDASLAYTAERLLNDGAGPWISLEGPPTVPAEAPSTAPASFEWVEQPMPAGASGFARLRVEVGP